MPLILEIQRDGERLPVNWDDDFPVAAKVTHADAFADGTPLCGFIADGESVTREVAEITCLDCLAAL